MARVRCQRCYRPESTCLCQWLKEMLIDPLELPLEVVIIQHPSEEFQAKGTARLLQLCLSNSRIEVLENLSADLQGLLADDKSDVLLFPAQQDEQVLAKSAVEKIMAKPSQYRLWLLDGTWRKARKLYYLNDQLQQLPKLDLGSLTQKPIFGGYSIRKAEREGQLSTFEAGVLSLSQLMPAEALNVAVLDEVFSEFIARQQRFIVQKNNK